MTAWLMRRWRPSLYTSRGWGLRALGNAGLAVFSCLITLSNLLVAMRGDWVSLLCALLAAIAAAIQAACAALCLDRRRGRSAIDSYWGGVYSHRTW